MIHLETVRFGYSHFGPTCREVSVGRFVSCSRARISLIGSLHSADVTRTFRAAVDLSGVSGPSVHSSRKLSSLKFRTLNSFKSSFRRASPRRASVRRFGGSRTFVLSKRQSSMRNLQISKQKTRRNVSHGNIMVIVKLSTNCIRY